MSLPPWWSKKQQLRKQNARSRDQERKRAKKTGGKVQPGSGSSYRQPGDIKLPEFLEELKYSDAKSYSLSALEWLRLEKRARTMGRELRMVIKFESHGVEVCITRVD